MTSIIQAGPFWRIASARMPTKWGMFDAVGFERDVCEVARKLSAKPVRALQASKRLMKWSFREQIKAAMEAETQEFSARVRSDEAREAFAAFLEKHRLSAEAVR
jgi:enoyl-CoA hydratase/carnithine racemase